MIGLVQDVQREARRAYAWATRQVILGPRAELDRLRRDAVTRCAKRRARLDFLLLVRTGSRNLLARDRRLPVGLRERADPVEADPLDPKIVARADIERHNVRIEHDL